MTLLDIGQPIGLPRIGEQGARVYEFAVTRRNFRESDITAEGGLNPHEAREALERLIRCKLLRRIERDPDVYEAVPPDRARALLLGAPARQINRWQEEVDCLREELARLVPMYETSFLARMSTRSVEILPDLDTTLRLITELAARCRHEVLTSQPGGARPPKVLEESSDRTLALLGRGVRMRTLYQYAAQFDLPTAGYVEDVVARGAEVRLVAGALRRLIVFDGEAALIERVHHREGAVLVHDPNVVEFMVATFEQTWLTATAFPLEYDHASMSTTRDDVQREIMRLFVQGAEDKVISRLMGISTRTCQRHISDIMRRIGARNRAHAGYLISKRNLLVT